MSSARSYRPKQTQPARLSRAATIDIVIQSPLWDTHPSSTAVLKRAIRQAASAVALNGGELAVVLADDSMVRSLNRTWRQQDKPTNVLSFPMDACPTAGAIPPLL